MYKRPLRPDELMHYGVKGQKWGIRRYQNPDGSLTPAGRERYSRTASALAKSTYNKAARKEPVITADVKEAVKSSGARMYGLEHRLKTKQSIERKIKTDALEKGISLQEAAKINDAVRYTSISTDSMFVKDYERTKRELERRGYSEVKCKNYWDKYRKGGVKHKSVTSVFQDNHDGYKFELQFQTDASQRAKDKRTPLYEERRKPNNDPKRNAELERQMVALAEQVPDPKDIYKIRSH